MFLLVFSSFKYVLTVFKFQFTDNQRNMETDEVQDMAQMSGEVTTESILISNLVLYRVWKKALWIVQNIMPCKNKKTQIIVSKVYVRKQIVLYMVLIL